MTSTEDHAYADALLAQTGWLRRLVRRLVHDPDAVDDLCQSTMLQAWRHKPAEGAGLRPWLATVARNLSGREAKRAVMRSVREPQAARPDAQPPASEVVERVAWQQSVVGAVMGLDEPYRTTLLLRFWEDLPPRKVARRLGVPVETVRTRTKRGLALVRTRLDRECGGREVWVTAVLPFAQPAGGAVLTSTLLVLMTKHAALTMAGVLALAVIALSAYWPDSSVPGDSLPGEGDRVAVASNSESDQEPLPAEVSSRRDARTDRVSLPDARLEDDPEIAAALCGFRGRVVAAGQPISGCGVRLFRLATDAFVAEAASPFGSAGVGPDLDRYDAKTGKDGSFYLEGVWPRGMYLLHYGRGTENPTYRVLEHTPAPGELVDLGEFELMRGAVLTGRVVDADGAPIEGAEIIGGDVPGAVFAAFPLQRLERDSVLLLRRPPPAPPVVELPSWAKALYEELPLARIYSDVDGRFRLTGLPSGANFVAVRKRGMEPLIESRVRLDVGENRDLGTLKLGVGEELWGRVVDTDGEPIRGAEVVAGPTTMLPADLASRIAPTNDRGEFTAMGFARGRVTVAARRGPGHPWVRSEPRPIDQDIVVELPASHDLTLRVTGVGGAVPEKLEVELAQGYLRTAVTMKQLGSGTTIDIDGKLKRNADGRWVIEGLGAGSYVVSVTAPGCAVFSTDVELDDDFELKVELDRATAFDVRVRSSGQPVRNAAIYARAHSDTDPPTVIPYFCGRTDVDGRLSVSTISAPRAVISSWHPAFGTVEVEAERDGGVVEILMSQPGEVLGTLTMAGVPVEAGAWSATLVPADPGPDVVTATPAFARVDADGRFRFGGVQPGNYLVRVVDLISVDMSIGRLVRESDSWFGRGGPSSLVKVLSGQPARVKIDLAGPVRGSGTGSLTGTLRINGQLAEGYRIGMWMASGPTDPNIKTDAGGRFTLLDLPAGEHFFTVFKPGSERIEVCGRSFVIADGEHQEIEVEIQTARISGRVVDHEGKPLAGMNIVIMGRPDDESLTPISMSIVSAGDGSFEHDDLMVGRYALRARSWGKGRRSSERKSFELPPGGHIDGIELVLFPNATVRGTIDRAQIGALRAGKLVIAAQQVEDALENLTWVTELAAEEIGVGGAFVLAELPRSTYKLIVRTAEGEELASKRLEVGGTDLDGVVFGALEDWREPR